MPRRRASTAARLELLGNRDGDRLHASMLHRWRYGRYIVRWSGSHLVTLAVNAGRNTLVAHVAADRPAAVENIRRDGRTTSAGRVCARVPCGLSRFRRGSAAFDVGPLSGGGPPGAVSFAERVRSWGGVEGGLVRSDSRGRERLTEVPPRACRRAVKHGSTQLGPLANRRDSPRGWRLWADRVSPRGPRTITRPRWPPRSQSSELPT